MTGADDFRAAIRAALGSAPDDIPPGRLVRFATDGKPHQRDGWALLFDDQRAGVYGDWRRGAGHDVWTAQGHPDEMTPRQRDELRRAVARARAERKHAQREAWAQAREAVHALWSRCEPVPADGSGDDAVTRYLRRRLAMPAPHPLAVPAAVRMHRGLTYHHDGEPAGTWPAMVAALHSPAGELVALHRTWLTVDGMKAPVPGPVKKLTRACGPVMGGCIRLGEPACGVIGAAEGLETALAAREASGLPVVACYSAGALEAWQWPRGMRRLVIFADADEAGRRAADALRQRARAAGLAVDVHAPSGDGADWCDVWAARPVEVVA